jgi:hypothetical protein
MLHRSVLALGLLGLGACSMLPQSQQQQISNTLVAGQLFCAQVTPLGPLIVALATNTGVPISVIGKTSSEVAAACALINATPVEPPPVPEQAPKVATPAPLALNGVPQS